MPADSALYTAAIFTGMRMGELYGLLWADVDLGRGVITVRRSYDQEFTKSKKVRHVRVNKQLGAALKLVAPSLPPPNNTAEAQPPTDPPPTDGAK